MTLDDVVVMTRDAFYIIFTVSAPVLLVSLMVGLIVSIFQTVTSIQEQTLTFVPKIICVFLAMMILGHWMLSSMKDYLIALWSDFGQYIH